MQYQLLISELNLLGRVIKMTYKLPTEFTGSGVMPLLFSIKQAVPLFFPFLSVSIMLLLTFGTYYSLRAETNKSKLLISFAAASFLTMILSIFLAMGDLLDIKLVMIYASASIISFLVLMLDKD